MKPPTGSLVKRVYKLESEMAFDYLKIANEVAKSGMKIISFGVGQPYFDTPDTIKEVAINALKAGYTGYVASAGIPELRLAIAEHVSKFTGADVKDNEVMVTPGGKQSIYFSIMSFVKTGDEVIISDPSYPTYESIVKYVGGKPVHIPLREEKEFRMTPEDVEKAVTGKTRMIVLNSPQNPTGGVNTRRDIDGILEIAKRKEIVVLSDEIYDHYVYDGEHASVLADSDWRDNVIYVNGFSKTYSMPGWRLGYAVARREVIDRFEVYADNTHSCVNSFVQRAGVVALTMPQDFFRDILKEYKMRRDYIYEGLNKTPGVKANKPKGTFYIFPNIKKILDETGLSTAEFTKKLIREKGVVTLPGTPAFSSALGEGYIRLNYGLPIERIDEGLRKLRLN